MKKLIFISLIIFFTGMYLNVNAQSKVNSDGSETTKPDSSISKSAVGIACKGCVAGPSVKGLPPSIEILVNGKKGGRTDTCEVGVWGSLSYAYTSSAVKDSFNYTVSSWQCIIQTAKGAMAFSGSGSEIKDEIRTYAKTCRQKDLIIFYNIHLSDDTGHFKIVDSGPVFRVF